MQNNDRNYALEIARGACRLVWLPFSYAASVPAAIRRSRGILTTPGQSAERAKFDTRKWTAALLKHIDWRRFEELGAAYFEAQGFAAKPGRTRADGGLDILLSAANSDAPTILAHCKPFDPYRVGIKGLRELRDGMAAYDVREGALLTPSRFTPEAVAFAKKENIQLLDGSELLARLAELAPEKSLALLKLATQGDFLTPTCPCCSIKMTSRKSTQGGRKFWGCLNYPKCKQTFSGTVPA